MRREIVSLGLFYALVGSTHARYRLPTGYCSVMVHSSLFPGSDTESHMASVYDSKGKKLGVENISPPTFFAFIESSLPQIVILWLQDNVNGSQPLITVQYQGKEVKRPGDCEGCGPYSNCCWVYFNCSG